MTVQLHVSKRKRLNMHAFWHNNCTSGVYHKKTILVMHKDLATNIYHSNICNIEQLETAQLSISKCWLNKL